MTVELKPLLENETDMLNFVFRNEKKFSEQDSCFLLDWAKIYRDVDKDERWKRVEQEFCAKNLITYMNFHHPDIRFEYEYTIIT